MTHSDSPHSPPPPQLAYERPSGITRGAFRLLLLLTFLNTILLGINLMGPQSWQAVRGVYADWKDRRAQAAAKAQLAAALHTARTFRFPEKHVAYTEDPGESMALVSQGLPYFPISTHGHEPPPGWQAPAVSKPLAVVAGADKVFRRPGVVFLHERTAPGGAPTLLFVICSQEFTFRNDRLGRNNTLETTYHLNKRRSLFAATIVHGAKGELTRETMHQLDLVLPDTGPSRIASTTRPSNSETVPADVVVPLAPGNRLRLFGGAPDPADPSHFTIPYELDGQPGVIDGWLKPEGIMLRPRQGRPIASAKEPTWELVPAAIPTSAPTSSARPRPFTSTADAR